ncbi:MAG TPA: hypothetical protein VMG62_06590 [Solirubrobacteraceae bacterium]|nr:hypothetical protein [Solirubrobacteraceae bacterium]
MPVNPSEPLACPTCARTQAAGERFCPHCHMPLVPDPSAGGEPLPTGERHSRARKVMPQYSEGALVKVARAQNQPEAELIQGLLLEHGIPSLARRAPGFDVPDFLASGARDVLVPQSGLEAARQALHPSGDQPA